MGKAPDDKQQYYFEIPVVATRFDTQFTVTFDNTAHSVTYSVNSYIATMHAKENTNSTLKEFLVALYGYGRCASAYQ